MKRLMLYLGCAATALSAPVAAQTVRSMEGTSETGTALNREPEEVEDTAKVNRYSKAVANCIHNRAAGQVDRMLENSDPLAIDMDAADVRWGRFRTLIEECMGQRMHEFDNDPLLARIGMSFSESRLRALLLEEAYLSANTVAPVIAEGASEQANRSFVSGGDDLVSAQGLAGFADCVVYRDARQADALLRTEPGSDDELGAARRLAPTLGACLLEGQSIEFTPGSIRSLAADGLWARTALGPAIAE